MKKFKYFIINLSVLIITSIIFRSIDMYFMSFVASKIGSENLGIYHLVMNIYLFGITLASSGINLSVTRIISEELALGNYGSIKKIMKRCLLITFFTSAISSLFIYFNTDLIIKNFLHYKVSSSVIYLICIALPLISMSSAISGYFAGVRKVYKNSIGQFIEHIAKVIVTSYILMIYLPNGLEYSCFALILGDLISELISFIYIFIIYLFDNRKYHQSTEIVPKHNYTRRILKISMPIAIATYIRSGLTTFKQLIIPSSLEKSGINCSESLSNYGIINGMALPIIMFPDILLKSFANLLVPEFSRYNIKKDYKRIKQITTILLFFIVSISPLITFLLFFFSDIIGTAIYKEPSVINYIKILAPLAIFIYVDTIIDGILKGLDAQIGIMIINIIDLLFSTLFIYFLVPKLGINGYIISIYISEIINFTISLLLLMQKLQ